MEVKFFLQKPEDLDASLTIRMKVKDWIDLREALLQANSGWQGLRLANAITDVVSQAKKIFYSDGEKDADLLG